MRTIDSVMNELTNVQKLITGIKEALYKIDPEFPSLEAAFQKSCERLLTVAGNQFSPSAQEYLDALELDFASSVIYIAGQGFQLNLEIFRNPSASLFLLQGDFEDITRERMLDTVPGVQKAGEIIGAFWAAVRKLPEAEVKKICAISEGISERYAYLETVGYKLAHYFGFSLANHVLPYVIPSYLQDPVYTHSYRKRLENCLELDLHKLDCH